MDFECRIIHCCNKDMFNTFINTFIKNAGILRLNVWRMIRTYQIKSTYLYRTLICKGTLFYFQWQIENYCLGLQFCPGVAFFFVSPLKSFKWSKVWTNIRNITIPRALKKPKHAADLNVLKKTHSTFSYLIHMQNN